MHPTFKDKEYILTNLIGLRFGMPHRGDVIVFKAPKEEEKDFIKRVIGEPGDTVLLKDGFVYVKGTILDESSYLPADVRTYGGSSLRDGEPVVVPEDRYFVMGDNRAASSDSREWGFLPKNDIIGISFFVYWPVNTMRVIKNPYNSSK